jgi:hypothetical protein
MAADYYLQLDGIKGESADSRHAGWLECLSINWSITQPKSATASTGAGRAPRYSHQQTGRPGVTHTRAAVRVREDHPESEAGNAACRR